jgi:hypothetical protein
MMYEMQMGSGAGQRFCLRFRLENKWTMEHYGALGSEGAMTYHITRQVCVAK